MEFIYLADAAGAVSVVKEYVTPTVQILSGLAVIVCTLFIVNSGYAYMTSSGNPERMQHAKHILKNALIGLVLVFMASTMVAVLTRAYGTNQQSENTSLPSLEAIPSEQVNNGLVDVLIKATTGFLNNIIQTIASPFLSALEFFTKSTPLMAKNSSVFNLWLVIVGIANTLLILVIVLIGFHIMSASSFGFDELNFKEVLPKVGLTFLLLNTSIFAIDGIIELSNVLIEAIGKVSASTGPWEVLSQVVKDTSGQGLAALLVMLAFLISSIILLVYYVGRLVTLFIGAVLSPFVILIWLIPGFRDFSESAIKTYLTTIFVLFVHVVILELAASLFVGVGAVGNQLPDTLMSMVIGLATIVALLKTHSMMTQFSFVSMGARNARKLSSNFVNGVSYLSGKSVSVAQSVGKNLKENNVKSPTNNWVINKHPLMQSQPNSSYAYQPGPTSDNYAKPVNSYYDSYKYKRGRENEGNSRTSPGNNS